MKPNASEPSRVRMIRRLLVGLTAVLVIGLLPVEAGHDHHKGHGHYKKSHKHKHVVPHVYVEPVYVVPPRVPLNVAPPRIAGYDVARYRPFLRGEVWYAPHRHVHAVYEFPVRTAYGTSYRQATYCNVDRFASGYVAYDGPRFHLSVGF